NPIACPQGSRQNQSDHERRTTADLQKLRKNVRRVRPEVRAVVFPYLGLRKLGEIVRYLLFCVAPGEIGVGLREAKLGQPVHYMRSGKGFRQEKHVAMLPLDLADYPLPERKCFGVRIVDPKDTNLLIDPELKDVP